MKKTLALLALVLLISTGAMAQLNVTSSKENTIEKLTQELKYDYADSVYYLTLATSNQFDDYMIFKLGKGKDNSIKTIEDLISFMENGKKGDMITADNGFGREYRIYVYDNLNLDLASDGYAGMRILQKPRLKRWIRLIQEH